MFNLKEHKTTFILVSLNLRVVDCRWINDVLDTWEIQYLLARVLPCVKSLAYWCASINNSTRSPQEKHLPEIGDPWPWTKLALSSTSLPFKHHSLLHLHTLVLSQLESYILVPTHKALPIIQMEWSDKALSTCRNLHQYLCLLVPTHKALPIIQMAWYRSSIKHM